MDPPLNDPNLENSDQHLVEELHIGVSTEVTTFELAFKHYNRLWSEAQNDLEDLVRREPKTEDEVEAVPTRMVLFRRTAILYLQYIKVANKLIKCYEHISQPQKRIFLRKVSEAAIGRALELKHELVQLDQSEFQFLDQTLLSLRMLPKDMDIKIPEYFQEQDNEIGGTTKENDLPACKKMVFEKLAILSEKEVDQKYIVTEEKKFVKTAMVYLRLIQAQERARQAKERFKECHLKYTVEELKERKKAHQDYIPKLSRPEAAVVIQRSWRKYHSKQYLRKGIKSEMEFLGMKSSRNKGCDEEEYEKDRLRVIKRNKEEYIKAREQIRAEYLVHKVPDLMEDLENRIRSYFEDYMELFGKYPEFPDEEEGGSTKMFETVIIKDEELEEGEEKTEDSKNDAKDAKGSKDAKDAKDDKKDGEEEGFKLKLSSFVPDMVNLLQEYKSIWEGKEPKNFDCFDPALLEQNVMSELTRDLQRVVDNKMRVELQRLVEAHEKDTKKKGKAKKKGKGKKGKDKKGKGKKEKDLTPDRSAESLIEELIANGIIKSYPKCKLEDFVGDYNYSGQLLSMSGIPENDPDPCLGDIRRIINEYCILPMGSCYIHSKGTFVRSVLLAGPRGVGKRQLVHAICSETNATLMDLSAENIDGKYPGDDGKEMLLHLVLKVGRLVQPTVIYIRDTENYFYKKVPPSCTLSDPGRLKKDLPKLLKAIGNDDRILVCGTTFQPFDVDLKGLGSSYNKVLCFPKPDYNCRRSLWRHAIRCRGGTTSRKLDATVLCSVSDGFVAAAILGSAKQVLTERRLAFQDKIPLEAVEFLKQLSEYVPVYEEEVAAYRQWLDKLPTRKKRIELLQVEAEEAGDLTEEEESEED